MKFILYSLLLSFTLFTFSCKKEMVDENMLFEKWDHSPNAQAFRDALNENMRTIWKSTQTSKLSFAQLVDFANKCKGQSQLIIERDSDTEKCEIALNLVNTIEHSKLMEDEAKKSNPEIWDYKLIWAKYVAKYSPKAIEMKEIRQNKR